MGRLLTILVLFIGALAMGADRYWTNAVNMSPYVAGDTVHLYGTFIEPLTVTNSGTEIAPITFKFEANAKFSTNRWTEDSIVINLNARSWVTFMDGLIEATDNGTPVSEGGDHTYYNGNIKGFSVENCNGITISNMVITNLYDRLPSSEDPMRSLANCSGVNGYGSNLRVLNCKISGQDPIGFIYGTTPYSNIIVSGNSIMEFNHGVVLASGASNSYFTNLVVSNNWFYEGNAYECSSNGSPIGASYFHRNPIMLFSTGFTDPVYNNCLSDVTICNNRFMSGGSSPKTTVGGSAPTYQDMYTDFHVVKARIYNNIVQNFGVWFSSPFGLGMGVDVLLANNTIVGSNAQVACDNPVIAVGTPVGGGWTLGSSNSCGYNNMCIQGGRTVFLTVWQVPWTLTNDFDVNAADFNSLKTDFNIFSPAETGSFWARRCDYGAQNCSSSWSWDTLAQWQNTAPGVRDANSTTSTPLLSSIFVPLTNDTVAYLKGTNLTQWAIENNCPGLTNDLAGNPRPVTGPWTIGAYEGGVAPPIGGAAGTVRAINARVGTLRRE